METIWPHKTKNIYWLSCKEKKLAIPKPRITGTIFYSYMAKASCRAVRLGGKPIR